jgi:hypothetical protein
MHIKSAVCAALLVSGLAGVATAPSAYADAPVLSKDVPFSGSFDDGGDSCGVFGVFFQYSGLRTYIDFYGPDGTLLKEIRHITFTGTLTNDVTGASVPYSGRFTRTFDASTDTVTITGLNSKVAGSPVTTGYSMFSLDSDASVAHGQDRFDPVVCAAIG